MALRNTRTGRHLFDLLIVLAGVVVTLLFLFVPSGGTPFTPGPAGANPPPPPPPPPPSGGGGGGTSCPAGYTHYQSNVNGQITDTCIPPSQPAEPGAPGGDFKPAIPAAKPAPVGPPPGDFAGNLPAASNPTASVGATPPDPGASSGGPPDPNLVDNSTPKDNGSNPAGEAAGGVLAAAAVAAAAIGVRPKPACDPADAAALNAAAAAACTEFNVSKSEYAQAAAAWQQHTAEKAALENQWQAQRAAFQAIKDDYTRRWWERYGAYGGLGLGIGLTGGYSLLETAHTAWHVARAVFLGGTGAWAMVPGTRQPSIEEQPEGEVDAAINRELARVDAEFSAKVNASQAEINQDLQNMDNANQRGINAQGQFIEIRNRWNPECGPWPACAGM
jgi:hypothetical protein